MFLLWSDSASLTKCAHCNGLSLLCKRNKWVLLEMTLEAQTCPAQGSQQSNDWQKHVLSACSNTDYPGCTSCLQALSLSPKSFLMEKYSQPCLHPADPAADLSDSWNTKCKSTPSFITSPPCLCCLRPEMVWTAGVLRGPECHQKRGPSMVWTSMHRSNTLVLLSEMRKLRHGRSGQHAHTWPASETTSAEHQFRAAIALLHLASLFLNFLRIRWDFSSRNVSSSPESPMTEAIKLCTEVHLGGRSRTSWQHLWGRAWPDHDTLEKWPHLLDNSRPMTPKT